VVALRAWTRSSARREEASDVVRRDDLERGHRDALRVLDRIIEAQPVNVF